MKTNFCAKPYRCFFWGLLTVLLVSLWFFRGEQDAVSSPDRPGPAVEAPPHPVTVPETGGDRFALLPEPAELPAGQSWEAFFAERDRGREPNEFFMHPIEDYPILTWEDRIDMEGQPAPRIPRGQHSRRILDDPVEREVQRDNPEPIRPFGQAQPARKESLFAHDYYSRSAIEVGLSNRIFHEAARGERHRMVVPLTVEKVVTVDLEKIVERGPHTFSFIGKVEGHEDSVAILVYNEGTVSGGVSLYGMDTWDSLHYEFMAMEDGLVAVRDMDPLSYVEQECGTCGIAHGAEIMHEEDEAWLEEEGEFGGDPVPMGDEVDHVVDIVVGYGRQARVSEGGVAAIEARIISSIERMNISFANSGVDNTQLVLLGMMEDPDYEFPGWDSRMQSELEALRSGHSAGHLQAIRQFRVDLGADLAAFIIRDTKGGSAGIGNVRWRYSVTARTFMSNSRLTFVHEIGHNFGLRHSWGDSSSDTLKTRHQYGWRHRSGSTRRRTVMAYDWGWSRAMYFANPDVMNASLGVRTGAVDGYDARGDDTTDSRYVEGGMIGSAGAGFDGSNSSLGARAAHWLINDSSYTAGHNVRAGLRVTAPNSAQVVAVAEPFYVEWVGGAFDDDVQVELWQGGALHTVLEEGMDNHPRTLIWTPEGLSTGDDYQIRLVLNDGEEETLSDPFSIAPDYPKVVRTFVAPLEAAIPGLSEVSVTFNRSMNPDSFSPGTDIVRFVGPGGEDLRGTFTGFSWSESDTVLTFSFEPLMETGFYRIDFGPGLYDLRGFPMDQNGNDLPGEVDDGYGFTFRVDEPGEGARVTIYETNFDDNPGFTFDPGWAIGPPNQSGVGGPGAAYEGNNVLGTYLSGNYPADLIIFAYSPSFDFTGASNISISFRKWMGIYLFTGGTAADRRVDSAQIHYSVDGGDSWRFVLVWNDLKHSGWTDLHTIQIPEGAEGQADVRFRFRLYTESDQSFGWNIDTFSVSADFENSFGPPPPPRVVGHMPSGAVIATPEAIWIDFDQPMDTESFSLSDLSGISGVDADFAVIGYSWPTQNRLRLDVEGVSMDGVYSLTLGTGVQSAAGDFLAEPYTASFDLGTFDPPEIVTQSLPMAHEGEAYSAILEALSPDGLNLRLSVSGLPYWLSFSDNGTGSGSLNGTPPAGAASPVSLTFTADDTANAVQKTFTFAVNRRPLAIFESPMVESVRIPDGVLLLFEGSVSDDGLPEGNLTQTWDVVSQPEGATVAFENTEQLETAVSFDTVGNYVLRFTVSDGVLSSVYDFAVENGAIAEEEGTTVGAVPSESLAVYLPLDESSGTLAGDASGNNRDGTISGEPEWRPEDGVFGGSLRFTGSSQHAVLDNSDGLDDVAQMSWAWWMRPSAQNSDVRGILSKRDSANSGQAWSFFLHNNNELNVDMPSSSNRLQVGAIPANEWTHVAVVFDGTQSSGERVRVYTNGVLSGTHSASISTLPGRSNSVVLGLLDTGDNRSFIGDLDEVLIYHGRAISSEEVTAIYEGQAGNIGPLVVAGESRTVDLSQSTLLSGIVEDDGFPEIPGVVSTEWLQKDGPAGVSFDDVGSVETGVSFPQTGVYTLRLTAFDGEIKTAHDKVVTVQDALEAPDVSEWPTAGGLVYGQTLGESTLSGGAATVPGTFAFVNPDTLPNAGTTLHPLRFMPEDSGTYAAVIGEVSVAVSPAAITVRANDLNKFAGQSDPEFTWTLTAGNLVGGDTLSGALVREAGEDVGTYAILQGTLTAGPNYDLTFLPGILTIEASIIQRLNFAANGGIGELPEEADYEAGSTVVVPGSGDLSKAGFVFNGWRDVWGAVTVQPGESFTMPGRDVTLVAQWTVAGGEPDEVLQFNFGDQNYTGTNSPGHAAGGIPNDFESWTRVNGNDIEFSPGRFVRFRRANGADLNDGVTLTQTASTGNRSTDTGTGVFATALGQNWRAYVRGGNAGRNVGAWLEGLPHGEWTVYAVVHNPVLIASGRTTHVGIGTGSQTTGDLAWNNAILTQTSFAASPQTVTWEEGVNYAKTTVTVDAENPILYVLQGGPAAQNDEWDYHTLTAIQLVRGSQGPGEGFTVTYESNGGDGPLPEDLNQYAPEQEITVMGQGAVSREGYVFTGWRDEEAGITYPPLDSFAMPERDVLLTAQWTAVSTAPSFEDWLTANNVEDGEIEIDGQSFPASHLFVMGASVNGSGGWEGILRTEAPVSDGNGGMMFRFSEQPGRRYTLERTENLTDPQWLEVEDFEMINGGDGTSLRIQLPQSTRAFYRIRVELE